MTPGSPMEADKQPGFIRKQFEFAAHIRDPENNPRPAEVEDRRMAIYRELFYNNVEDFVSNAFPVLRSLYNDKDWHTMVHSFFASHKSRTPYFLEISEEFLAYLQNEHKTMPCDPPFILELAHYEWIELASNVSELRIDESGVDPDGDLVEGTPVLSSLAWPLQYSFDVHHISPEYQPQQPLNEPTNIVVYRDRNDETGFMEINAVTARLLQLISDNPEHTGKQHLKFIADEMNHPNPGVVINGGREIMEGLRNKDILLGSLLQ